MGKLFGTDGIRGVANETLDAKLAYRVGQAAAISLCDDSGTKPTVVIGKDTRISSDMLEGALVAGLTACGCNAILLGVIPTPAVAYLTVYLHADAGIVISASHNPYEHNGIKMFSSEGFKLSDALEARIEDLILQDGELPVKTHGEIGQVMSGSFAAEYYLDHLASTIESLEPLRVLIDCANGAASTTARYLFGRFPLEAEYLNDKPNGVNINNGCGSTHLEALCDAVKAGGYDLGIAFDGDADRCLTVDEQGCVIDGDKMMAICADAMEKRGRLRGGGFVATVMSNIGLHKYCAGHGLRLLCASVGDRNVLELMQKEGMRLGGEQSGHIIFSKHATTGDGILTSLKLMEVILEKKETLAKLADEVQIYPQVLKNVRVKDKEAAQADRDVQAEVQKVSDALGDTGRILVRPSGTEPLIRVMVEAPTDEICGKYVAQVVEWKNTKSPAFACESGRCWVASYCACAVLGKEIPAFP